MKKTLIAILTAAGMLLLCCCGSPATPAGQAFCELTPLGRLLTASKWTDTDGRGLEFCEDMTGSMDGAGFVWRADGDRVSLRFFPGCSAGGEKELSAAFSGGALTLSCGSESYMPEFLSAARAAGAAEAVMNQPDPLEQFGREIADFALDFLGGKYKYGGKSPETGFDCSGLVYYVYDHFGYRIERIANDQAKQGVKVEPDELMPGDLIAFYKSENYVGHVGIYIGAGYYIHAQGEAYGVVLSSLDDPYLQRKYEARRFIGCTELLTKNVEAAADTPSPAASSAMQNN